MVSRMQAYQDLDKNFIWIKENLSTLMHDHYGYESNVDGSANMSDYPEDSSWELNSSLVVITIVDSTLWQ